MRVAHRRATKSMAATVFVDTNVLVYARDARAADKQRLARAWLDHLAARERVVINRQILNELTRWIMAREPHRELARVRREIDVLANWGARPIEQVDVELAWLARERFGFQWFDCLLLGAAAVSGCGWFLSEDMVHGTRFEGVTVVSPFEVAPHEI